MPNKATPYPIPTVCDTCGAPVVFGSNAEIYGKEYGSGMCYRCVDKECDSYVGVHDGTRIPFGRLANKELRELKMQCHALFDPVWKGNKRINREQAYGRLANLLGIPAGECHFGWFDKDMLLRCLEIIGNEQWYVGVNWR